MKKICISVYIDSEYDFWEFVDQHRMHVAYVDTIENNDNYMITADEDIFLLMMLKVPGISVRNRVQ